MARKRVKQRAVVGGLGKALTRRSRGTCELCSSKNEPFPWELPPFPEEPDPDRTLMACARCRQWLETGNFRPIEAHFLSAAVWSEEPAVQLAAARLLLAVDDPEDPWVRDALDAVDVDPETGEFRSREADLR
jgi:protein PhnA